MTSILGKTKKITTFQTSAPNAERFFQPSLQLYPDKDFFNEVALV